MNDQVANATAKAITETSNTANTLALEGAESLKEALSAVITTAATAKDFVLAELPKVFEELLKWKFYESIMYNIIGIGLLLICYLLLYFTKKNWELVEDFCMEEFMIVFCVVVSTLSVFSLPFLFNLDWLQILVAPKVYLIEYASKLLGGN